MCSSDLVTIFRFAGGAFGTAATGVLVYAMLPDVNLRALLNDGHIARNDAVIAAFHAAFLFAALLTAASAAVALRMPRVKI